MHTTHSLASGGSVLVWMFVFQLATASCWLILPIALPRYLLAEQHPLLWVTYLSGFMFFCALGPTLASASLCHRWGPAGLTQRAMLLCILGLMFLSYGELWALIVGIALIGIGYGAAAPGASVLLKHYVPPNRVAFAFSVRQAGVPVAGILAGLFLAPWIERGWVDYCVLILAALSLLLVFSSWAVCKRLDDGLSLPVSTSSWSQRIRETFLGRRRLQMAVGHAFAFGFMQNTIFACLVLVLETRGQLSLAQAGQAYALMSLSGAVARVYWGWYVDRGHSALLVLRGIAVVSALSALTLFIGAAQLPFVLVLTLSAMLGATASGWNGVFLAYLSHQVPSSQLPSLSAVLITAIFAGNFAGPVAYGLASGLVPHPAVALLPAVALTIWSVVFMRKE